MLRNKVNMTHQPIKDNKNYHLSKPSKVYIYICVQIYTYKCVYVCICMYIHRHICTCVCVCVSKINPNNYSYNLSIKRCSITVYQKLFDLQKILIKVVLHFLHVKLILYYGIQAAKINRIDGRHRINENQEIILLKLNIWIQILHI